MNTKLNWNTTVFRIADGRIQGVPLSFYEDYAMLPREHGADFRYFVAEDSEGLFWVMKCPVQGARPIRISHHETEEEAKSVASGYNVLMAYERALEHEVFETEFDAQQFLNETEN